MNVDGMGWMDGEKTAHGEQNEQKEHSPLAWSNSFPGVGSGVKISSPQLHARNFKNTQPFLSRGFAQSGITWPWCLLHSGSQPPSP